MIVPEPLPELALVQRALAGDFDATALLLKQIRPVVMGTARRLSREPQDVEDAAQHVYYTLFSKALRSYRGGTLRGFVATVAAYQVRTYFRKRSSDAWHQRLLAPAEDEPDPLERVGDTGPTPEEIMRSRELLELVARLLPTLTEQQQQILTLTVFHDQSPAEIAELIGCTSTTVRTTLLRLRRRIDELLSAPAQQPEEP